MVSNKMAAVDSGEKWDFIEAAIFTEWYAARLR